VLAALVRQVYTMEIIEPLAVGAKERLARLGYGNVEVKFADGYYGWPEKGPFDAIIVTAAANHIPPPLVEQLRPGGRLVVPVGERFAVQHLLLVHKLDDERLQIRQILPVRFVPLTGGHG
jgi:protein-L-isoaspartate(D-aspartate) O-methyltransferase